jgi:hypothetical protein
LVARLGGNDTLFAMYDRLLLLISARPGTQVVQCPEGGADAVYGELRQRLDA